MKSTTGLIAAFSLVLTLIFSGFSPLAPPETLSRGQTVYVSAYSNIFTAPRAIPFSLETTLIIRNTDMSHSLTVAAADFYDTEGRIIRHFADSPIILAPLETKYIYLPEKKVTGGLGANFIVRWSADRNVNPPIIECLMIGSRSNYGISFLSSGRVIEEHLK